MILAKEYNKTLRNMIIFIIFVSQLKKITLLIVTLLSSTVYICLDQLKWLKNKIIFSSNFDKTKVSCDKTKSSKCSL